MENKKLEAIILAGGFGTRLQSVVSDVPKPMAPMDDKGTPFLEKVLASLEKQGFSHVVLSIGYMGEKIRGYFGDKFGAISIDYVTEDNPLGTGGAVKLSLKACHEENVFILNGDTILEVNLPAMLKQHESTSPDMTIAVKEMTNFHRYGAVIIGPDGYIKSFQEKKHCARGYINGGVYCVRKDLFATAPEGKFSLESYMEENADRLRLKAYKTEGYFIDIGVPEDYERAKRELGEA